MLKGVYRSMLDVSEMTSGRYEIDGEAVDIEIDGHGPYEINNGTKLHYAMHDGELCFGYLNGGMGWSWIPVKSIKRIEENKAAA